MDKRNGLRFGGRGGFGSYKHYEQTKMYRGEQNECVP